MLKLKAKYIGKTCAGFDANTVYEIELNNNSNIVFQVKNNIRKPYKSLTEFLKDWTDITHIKQ